MIDADFRAGLGDCSSALDKPVARPRDGNAIAGVPQIGQMVPDFMLPDARDRLLCLHDALERGPLILQFHRGHWCDVCHLNMTALAEPSPRLAALGCQIVAISPQNAETSGQLARDAGADSPMLCDVDLGVWTALGLSHVIDDALRHEPAVLQGDREQANLGHGSLMPVTASVVLSLDGRILARHVDPDPRMRIDGDAILQAASEFQFDARG